MTCKKQLKKSSRTSGGFTLIEVLVALTIMALITGVAFAGLRIGIDSWERGMQRIEELDRRVSMERLIQRQLALAEPNLFRGNSRELEFASTYSFANGPGDLVLVKYSFGFDKFLYSEKPAYFERFDSIDTEIRTSSSRTGLRYLNIDESGKAVWVSDWNREGLPLAVQIEMDGDVLTTTMVNRK